MDEVLLLLWQLSSSFQNISTIPILSSNTFYHPPTFSFTIFSANFSSHLFPHFISPFSSFISNFPLPLIYHFQAVLDLMFTTKLILNKSMYEATFLWESKNGLWVLRNKFCHDRDEWYFFVSKGMTFSWSASRFVRAQCHQLITMFSMIQLEWKQTIFKDWHISCVIFTSIGQ